MNFQVAHQIHYTYSAPVFLEPHILRLQPRNDACQQIMNFSMHIDPQPTGIHHFLDAAGNNAACLWFSEKTDFLNILTSFEAQTTCSNPFNYFITDEDFLKLPAHYQDIEAVSLAPCLKTLDLDEATETFCHTLMAEAQGSTLDFLNCLCNAIYKNFTVEIRDRGPAFAPSITMQKKRGACRDLALLFVALCRSAGLAARFVSGYEAGDENMARRHLHAWAEVYIPGGGWKGYDPTNGLAVAERHIAVAAGHDPKESAAVKGNFRGTGTTSQIDFHISLETLPE